MKAVALDLDGFTGGGATAIGDLADAVRRVRADLSQPDLVSGNVEITISSAG